MRTPNPHSLIGQKSTVLIGQDEVNLIEDANEDIAVQLLLIGEGLSLLD